MTAENEAARLSSRVTKLEQEVRDLRRALDVLAERVVYKRRKRWWQR